jgi:peptidoglycan/LPS O-acetylase OafA/YrhL
MRRNVAIDALRGVAILMVVGHHLDCLTMGWAGVDLFFVLSGFLISGLLFREWLELGSIGFGRFYLRRAFKIYPAFYCLLLVTLVVNFIRPGIPSFPVTWESVLGEATFTQNYLPAIWGQTWSLGVEEHFYILLPIVLWLMYRRRSDTSDPFKWIPILFMLVATAEIGLRVATAAVHIGPPGRRDYLTPTHLRIDGLLFGVLLSYYRHFHIEKFKELANSRTSTAIIFFAAILLLVVPGESPIMYTVGYSCLYFGFGFLLTKVVDYEPGRRASILVHPLAKIGYYSYSIYLWHGWVCRLLPRSNALSLAASLLACLLLGIVMAKIIEYPALALRDHVFPARTAETVAAVA